MHFLQPSTPTPAKTPARCIYVYHPIGVDVLSDSLTTEQYALLNHLEALRDGILASPSVSKQLECAVLLIDLYEAILEKHGILIYEDQQEVVEH